MKHADITSHARKGSTAKDSAYCHFCGKDRSPIIRRCSSATGGFRSRDTCRRMCSACFSRQIAYFRQYKIDPAYYLGASYESSDHDPDWLCPCCRGWCCCEFRRRGYKCAIHVSDETQCKHTGEPSSRSLGKRGRAFTTLPHCKPSRLTRRSSKLNNREFKECARSLLDFNDGLIEMDRLPSSETDTLISSLLVGNRIPLNASVLISLSSTPPALESPTSDSSDADGEEHEMAHDPQDPLLALAEAAAEASKLPRTDLGLEEDTTVGSAVSDDDDEEMPSCTPFMLLKHDHDHDHDHDVKQLPLSNQTSPLSHSHTLKSPASFSFLDTYASDASTPRARFFDSATPNPRSRSRFAATLSPPQAFPLQAQFFAVSPTRTRSPSCDTQSSSCTTSSSQTFHLDLVKSERPSPSWNGREVTTTLTTETFDRSNPLMSVLTSLNPTLSFTNPTTVTSSKKLAHSMACLMCRTGLGHGFASSPVKETSTPPHPFAAEEVKTPDSALVPKDSLSRVCDRFSTSFELKERPSSPVDSDQSLEIDLEDNDEERPLKRQAV